jgi:hypothetical protein
MAAVLLRLVYLSVTGVFGLLRLLSASDRDKDVEIVVLRHQIMVLQRQLGTTRPRISASDRAFLAALLHRFPAAGSARSGYWSASIRCCDGTATCWPVASRPGPFPRGRDGRAPSARSGCWCCAWLARILARATGASTASCSSWVSRPLPRQCGRSFARPRSTRQPTGPPRPGPASSAPRLKVCSPATSSRPAASL